METTFENPLADPELEREAQLRADAFIDGEDITEECRKEILIKARAYVMEMRG